MEERFKGLLAVGGFVEKDGKLLVIREKIPHNDPNAKVVISQPGGHVEHLELFSEAVVREVMEETGYKVKPVEIIGIYQSVYQSRTGVIASFGCELLEDVQQKIEAPEVVETLWLTEKEIMSRKDEHRSKNTTNRFKDYFSGKHLPLSALNEIDHR